MTVLKGRSGVPAEGGSSSSGGKKAAAIAAASLASKLTALLGAAGKKGGAGRTGGDSAGGGDAKQVADASPTAWRHRNKQRQQHEGGAAVCSSAAAPVDGSSVDATTPLDDAEGFAAGFSGRAELLSNRRPVDCPLDDAEGFAAGFADGGEAIDSADASAGRCPVALRRDPTYGNPLEADGFRQGFEDETGDDDDDNLNVDDM